MGTPLNSRLVLTWLTVLVLTVGAAWLQSARHGDAPASDDAPQAATVAPIGIDRELIGKIVVLVDGLRAGQPGVSSELVLRNAAEMSADTAPFVDRLAYAVLVGRVDGWTEGAARASELACANDAEKALRDDVVAVMEARAKDAEPKPSAEACARIEEALGFFGRVACDAPGLQAEGFRVAGVLIGVVAWYGTVFLVGAVMLAYGLFRLFGRGRRGALEPQPERMTLILGETFALWMVVFLGINVGIGALAGPLGLRESAYAAEIGLALNALGFMLSLGALAYPFARGVSKDELLRATGLHRGRGVLSEIGEGALCYLSAVPLLAIGLVIYVALTAIVTAVFGEQKAPSHPVADLFAGAGALRIALLFLIASVVAPIVEETMFRGVFYGHLRSSVFTRSRAASIVTAAIASSFVFAVIHPQGVLFVPALGGLAVGFCLSRELRGSLIAPMVAHGINNAVTLTIGLSLMS